MVAELVREHVRLRGVAALGAELAGQLVEEAGVQVDRGVARAVEGPDGRARGAAGGRHLAGERDHLDLLVAVVGAGPVGLDRVRVRHEPALAVAGDVGARGALLVRRGGGALRLGLRSGGAAHQVAGVDAEEQGQHQHDQPGAAAEGDLAAVAAAGAAHLRGIQLRVVAVLDHVRPPLAARARRSGCFRPRRSAAVCASSSDRPGHSAAVAPSGREQRIPRRQPGPALGNTPSRSRVVPGS